MVRIDEFPPLPPDRYEAWMRFGKWDTVWYPQFLGLEVEDVRRDYARMRLPYRPEFRQPARVWHGGVIASMIDTVVVPAVGSAYDEPRQLFTIDMQIRYLAPIGEEDAVAEGWVVKRGTPDRLLRRAGAHRVGHARGHGHPRVQGVVETPGGLTTPGRPRLNVSESGRVQTVRPVVTVPA
ncbi:MAG: hypothetical protein KatS3mg010_0293 [Acidimicrobiia bacterium]|nr:MAG: hypothetical protein KatS3mg010_0293 [Acidimicrobiia bacterium]